MLIGFLLSLIKSTIAGIAIGISGFLYSTALRVVDSSKVYELGHLAGAAVNSVGFIICSIFKLPVFVGRLGNVFEDASTKLFITSFPAMIIGNVAGCIGVGLAVHFILKHKKIMFIVKEIADERTKLTNVNQYVDCALSGVFSGALLYLAVQAFDSFRLKPRAFVILIFLVLLSTFNDFQYSIGNIFYFAYAGMKTKYVFINVAICVVANVIGTLPISLMFKVSKKVAPLNNEQE